MKNAIALMVLLGGLALAGGREPGPITPMNQAGMNHGTMNHSAHTMQMQMADMLKPLRPLSGKAFDVKWTQLMIDHHQMAVDMARHAAVYGKNLQVRNAAQQVIDAQEKEIALMQGWLKSWTGKAYAPKPMMMDMDMSGNMSMDRWFLEGMIPHHQGAIDMSNLIPSRTQNADLRKMGQDIIRVQTAEINEYRELLKTVK